MVTVRQDEHLATMETYQKREGDTYHRLSQEHREQPNEVRALANELQQRIPKEPRGTNGTQTSLLLVQYPMDTKVPS